MLCTIISALIDFVLNRHMAVSNQEQLLDEPRRLALWRGAVVWCLAFAGGGWPAPRMPASDGSAGFSFSSDK